MLGLKRNAAQLKRSSVSKIVSIIKQKILIKELKRFGELGYPILIGPSRKSFIGLTLDLPVDERLEGTAAAITASIINGARIIRVHDVLEMKRVQIISDKIKGAVA